jgi:hypothetical protein
MQECGGPPQRLACAGAYWFRPFSRFRHEYWGTRKTPNGLYGITIRAEDLAGNTTTEIVTVSMGN